MEVRLQKLNDDTVLEITETVQQKTRYVEADLIRQQTYFTEMITKGQAGLDRVNSLLGQIQNEKLK
jgi:hypothetical protein